MKRMLRRISSCLYIHDIETHKSRNQKTPYPVSPVELGLSSDRYWSAKFNVTSEDPGDLPYGI